MLIYAIAVIPLILHAVQKLHGDTTKTKAAGYADDLFGGGTIVGLKMMWDIIKDLGPEYGYYQQVDKTWIIVKPKHLEEAQMIFKGTDIKITVEGRKHLGAAIGSACIDLHISMKKSTLGLANLHCSLCTN